MTRKPNEPDLTKFLGRVAAEIRRRREKRKMSVLDAASAAGMPAPTWYRWEQGKGLPLDALPAIAETLGCLERDLLPRGQLAIAMESSQ